MKTARRSFLLLGGGAAAGAVLTPAPWKLLDDVSIWTQNWSWIPRPLRGEIKTRYTVCTLCPGGCGVKARCVGDQPVAVAGVPQHPVSAGKLCAMGLGAHQLAYHPLRAPAVTREALERVKSLKWEEGRTVLLDLYPGRAASAVYARLPLTYATLTRSETSTVRQLAKYGEAGVGLDVEKARTIVSFGAPVLERWGRVLAAWSGAERPKVVQVETALSRSATLADVWLPVRPGTEGLMARALRGSIETPTAAGECGVPQASIEEAMRLMKENGPVLALSAGQFAEDDEWAVAALNAGSEALVRRAASGVATPDSKAFESIEDGSIKVLFIDHGPVAASPGWSKIAPKLAKDAFVVSLSPYVAGDAKRANVVLPTAAWMEGTEDVVHAEDAARSSYTIAPALLPKPEWVVDPVEVLGGASGAREAEMKSRVEVLHKAGRGEVFQFGDASRTAVKEIESAEKLWELFQAGACWIGEAPTGAALAKLPEVKPVSNVRAAVAAPPALLEGAGVLPPLACKLTQESRLFTRSV